MGEQIRWDVTESNPKEAMAAGGAFESPRPGQYTFKISEVNKKGSGGDPNKPMLEVILQVVDAEKEENARFAGSRLWYYVLLPGHPSYQGFPVQKADQFWLATGVATERKRKGTLNTADLEGLTIGGVVRAGKNLDGDYRGEIASVHPYDAEGWKNGSVAEDEEDLPDLDLPEDDAEEEDEDSYNDWSIADLKAELEGRGLKTAGKKSVLVARLELDDAAEDGDDEDEDEDEEETPAPVKARRRGSESDFPFKK